MTKENLYEILGDINENYVKEAEAIKKTRKPSWVKWGVMVACLCLVIIGALITPDMQSEPNEPTQPDRTNLLIVNEAENVIHTDMDVQITSLDKLPYSVANCDSFIKLKGSIHNGWSLVLRPRMNQSASGYKFVVLYVTCCGSHQ